MTPTLSPAAMKSWFRLPAASVLAGLALWSGAVGPVRLSAGLPEPDTVFYGTLTLDGVLVTAANTDVTVELRHTAEGPPVASYRMGTSIQAGNNYLLRARVESAAPVRDPAATPLGGTLYVVVKQGPTVRDTRAQVLTARGTFVNLNFGEADTDGDGMSDEYEQRYFGSATGGDATTDPDLDGRPNAREFLQGTDPLVADGRHPADLSPADDRLNIQEITEYALAWKLGTAWSVEPLVIPVDYVTRASALWVGGELYRFDNDPVTTAPLWWVNDVSIPPGADSRVAANPVFERELTGEAAEQARQLQSELQRLGGTPSSRARQSVSFAQVTRQLPWNYSLHQPFSVTVSVTPEGTTRAFAVEEVPPPGWLVRFVSGGGRFDTKNQRIKWGPFFGTETRTLTYEVTPLNTPGEASFAGTGSFDGTSQVIAGRSVVFVPGTGPAPQLVLDAMDEGVRLRLTGVPGRSYAVESSADLLGWEPLVVLTPETNGEVAWDLVSGTETRFFRLRP